MRAPPPDAPGRRCACAHCFTDTRRRRGHCPAGRCAVEETLARQQDRSLTEFSSSRRDTQQEGYSGSEAGGSRAGSSLWLREELCSLQSILPEQRTRPGPVTPLWEEMPRLPLSSRTRKMKTTFSSPPFHLPPFTTSRVPAHPQAGPQGLQQPENTETHWILLCRRVVWGETTCLLGF